MDAFSVGKRKFLILLRSPLPMHFGLIGGGGCILPLVIAILWASKRQEQRSIAKFGLTTCLFNITEQLCLDYQ